MKKTIYLHQVDAFTDKLFGGNPAGVVTNADGLSDEEMAKIAREMNLSETAFVLKPTSGNTDLKLRYFTPAAEIKFCGHATIGTLYALAKHKLHDLGKRGSNAVRIETGAGTLDMLVTNIDEHTGVSFSVPFADLAAYHLQGAQFAKKFGIPKNILGAGTVFVEEKPQKFIFAPIESLEYLKKLKYDAEQVRKQFADEGVIIFCFYTTDTYKKESHLHARGFGPLIGLDEDPFTGAIQAGLTLSAKQNGYIDSGLHEIKTEQGHIMGRPGVARVTHDVQNNIVIVSAEAVEVFSTKLEL